MIGRRHVLLIGGYDPITPERRFERFRRSLSNFERTWNISSQTSAMTDTSKVSACWDAKAWGPNWKTRITFEMLRWDDLILRESRTRNAVASHHSMFALFDFAATGTWFRYVGANWKYAGFFIFPYVSVALFGLVGAGLAYAVTRLSGLTGVAAAIAGILIAVVIFLGLMHWLGPRRRINHALDDNIFSRQLLHGQQPEMEQRIDDFAGRNSGTGPQGRCRRNSGRRSLAWCRDGARGGGAELEAGSAIFEAWAAIMYSDGRRHDPEVRVAPERRSVSRGDANRCRRDFDPLGGIPGA